MGLPGETIFDNVGGFPRRDAATGGRLRSDTGTCGTCVQTCTCTGCCTSAPAAPITIVVDVHFNYLSDGLNFYRRTCAQFLTFYGDDCKSQLFAQTAQDFFPGYLGATLSCTNGLFTLSFHAIFLPPLSNVADFDIQGMVPLVYLANCDTWGAPFDLYFNADTFDSDSRFFRAGVHVSLQQNANACDQTLNPPYVPVSQPSNCGSTLPTPLPNCLSVVMIGNFYDANGNLVGNLGGTVYLTLFLPGPTWAATVTNAGVVYQIRATYNVGSGCYLLSVSWVRDEVSWGWLGSAFAMQMAPDGTYSEIEPPLSEPSPATLTLATTADANCTACSCTGSQYFCLYANATVPNHDGTHNTPRSVKICRQIANGGDQFNTSPGTLGDGVNCDWSGTDNLGGSWSITYSSPSPCFQLSIADGAQIIWQGDISGQQSVGRFAKTGGTSSAPPATIDINADSPGNCCYNCPPQNCEASLDGTVFGAGGTVYLDPQGFPPGLCDADSLQYAGIDGASLFDFEIWDGYIDGASVFRCNALLVFDHGTSTLRWAGSWDGDWDGVSSSGPAFAKYAGDLSATSVNVAFVC